MVGGLGQLAHAFAAACRGAGATCNGGWVGGWVGRWVGGGGRGSITILMPADKGPVGEV
jgi:hypothetical protein